VFPLSLDGRELEGTEEAAPLRVLLDLSGEGGGLFLLVAEAGRLAVTQVDDRSVAVDVGVAASVHDLEAILDGGDDAQLALRTGRLRVDGDRTLALRLRQLLTPR
jgi:putative sterol carrier protein